MEQMQDKDEGLWQLYLTDCQMHDATPSIKDFLIWCSEEGYDEPDWKYSHA